MAENGSAGNAGTRIAIMGGGAIGALWAAGLARAGNDVLVVDVAPDVVEGINANGLVVETAEGPQPPVQVRAVGQPEGERAAEVVFFLVKAHQTAAAAELARELVVPETTIVTQQNGWGSADLLARLYTPDQLVVGITYHSAISVGPGRVRHTGRGQSFAGPFEDGGDMARSERVGALLNAAGIETAVTPQVKTEIWKKLVLNCATLPTAALTRLTASEAGTPGPLLDLLDAITREAAQVARAQGYEIDDAERVERVHAVLKNGGAGKPSMLQDVESGRKTEIEVINGAVVHASEAAGIDVPLNRAMLALVGGLERSYLSRLEPTSEVQPRPPMTYGEQPEVEHEPGTKRSA
jgi:2-dehydropantoate 2-reductase